MYKENLPEECPLVDAADVALTDVWRFVKTDQITEECFASHDAIGKQRPDAVDACLWASCSLFEGAEYTAARLKTQFGKRFIGRVKLEIPAGSGRSLADGVKHIHFWAYEQFEFVAHVVAVEPK